MHSYDDVFYTDYVNDMENNVYDDDDKRETMMIFVNLEQIFNFLVGGDLIFF